MSASNVTNANIKLALSSLGRSSDQTSTGGTGQRMDSVQGVSFSDIALRVASLQEQTLGALMNSSSTAGLANDSGGLNALLASLNSPVTTVASSSAGGSINGLSATGRVSALPAPEAAYQLMTFINKQELAYKSQFSELGQMQSALSEMQQNAQNLDGIGTSTDNESIKSQLQKFASQYNDWVKRFDADMQTDGILAGTQAAQVSRYELEQSVSTVLNGRNGLRGLSDMGLTIDPGSKLAVLDTARLDSVLASNKTGVVNTLHEFSANFAKSAEMLNSDGNFIKNRLDNLSRAINFISENKPALQSEFGLGDAPQSTSPITQAAAAYKLLYGV